MEELILLGSLRNFRFATPFDNNALFFIHKHTTKLGSIIPVIFLNTDQSTPLFGQQYHTVLINFLSVELLELCAI